jgi:hypothetical protein
MKFRLIVFVFTLTSISCEKNNDLVKYPDSLIGNWINPRYSDSIVIFEKSADLKNNEYGLSFKQAGIFVERKNSGWCGTPPISYADYEGTWIKNDSIISITVGYWGGSADYNWKVVSINNGKLKIINVKEDYHFVNE